MRDLTIVEGPGTGALTGALSEALRAKRYRFDGLSSEDIEGAEVLIVYSIAEPLAPALDGLVSIAERISGRAKRMVIAVPYMGLRAGRRVSQYLAGGLDLIGADHIIVADPSSDEVTALRTPVVAISALPEIAKWISGRAGNLTVMAPPRLENRAEAFAGLLGTEPVILPTDDPRDWGKLGGSMLVWDRVTSCGELGEIGGLGAEYYVIPHVGCGEELDGLVDRVAASDSVDNPYAKASLAGPLSSVVLSL